LNAYARSLPALGFDPAPGDVDLTRNLAQRHAMVAQEARQVLALLDRLNLSVLQGRTADALRAAQGTLPPALRSAATAACRVSAAASSWANQLSGFQAEADALERQAAAAMAQQQALQAQQAMMPPGALVLADDLKAASTTVSGIHGRAQELHQRYLATASQTAAGVDQHSSLWEGTEPVRKVLEFVLAPLDMVAADHWVSALEKIASVPSELEDGVGEKIEEIEKLLGEGKNVVDELIAAGKFTQSAGEKTDAWYAFAPDWLKTAAGSLAGIKGLSSTLGGLGLVADAGTVISPQNRGTLGWVDRGAAGVNGFWITADLVTGEIPVAGEVMLAATGMYLAGDFLYQHWTPFRNLANYVGHANVEMADDDGHAIVKAAEEVGHAADTTWQRLDSDWHAVTSVGSWL
jgi:hypothetical protein